MSDLTPIKNDATLQPFFAQNPDFDLPNFNFFDETAVTALNWENLERDTIGDRLKAYQRLLRLGVAPSDVIALCDEKGKSDSALAIASYSEAEFVNVSRLQPETAKDIHRQATQKTAGAMVLLANAIQFSSPRQQTMLSDNAVQIRANFQFLPSYQKLFGSLDYLQCEHCQSIFGPAAYFVNLMQIVDQYITQVNSNIPKELKLNERRPDLENIPLTCDNTNDTVPYIQIVNEVLVERLKGDIGSDVFQHLATAKYPSNLPFNLYLEQIRLYMGHLNTNLPAIYQTFHPQDPYSITWAREYLELSPEEYTLITTANSDDLSDRYGVEDPQGDNFWGLTDKNTFLQQTGLSWQELNDLFYQNMSPTEITGNIANQFYINNNTAYLNLNQATIENLSLARLDRIDRFLRLARKLSWSFADLDWAIASIKVTDINEEAIKKIAPIKQLQVLTKLPLDVLCSFWHDMKTIGKGDKDDRPQDLFDRIFNNPLILQGQDDSWAASLAMDWKWKIEAGDTDDTKQSSRSIRSRLLAALQLSDQELTDIVEGIWGSQTSIQLNLANLSRLFRISQMLQLLGLKVEEYQLLLKFLNQSLKSLEKLDTDKLIKIQEFAEWLKASGFSLYELDYILHGIEHPSVEVFLPEEKMASSMGSLWQTVQLPTGNLTEEQRNRLNEELANHFGIEPELFSILAQLGAQTVGANDYIPLLLTEVGTDESGWQSIVDCLKFISQMYLLVNKLELTETVLKSITTNPQAYNITSPNLTGENIQNLYNFKKQLVPVFNGSEDNLVNFLAAPSIDKLAELTDWKQEQINQVIQLLSDSNLYNSVEGLLQLKQCIDMCATLGSRPDFLGEIGNLLENGSVANKWDTYQQIASSVIHLAKAKYSNEEWEKVFGELNGSLEEGKSQILTEFALWTLQLENRRQLSEYLLLDVEMTSCACNSLIQLAILSVQTYLQRCRMGVEESVTKVDIPKVWWEWISNYRIWEANRKVFLYPENYIDPSLRRDASPLFKELQDELLQSDITAEAVESAYLNYFDKFAELAKLQIVDSGRYWVQTSKSPDPIDTLFILAKTLTQPHTFYYRRCEQPTAEKPLWGYWEKIDLQINSDYLAPVHAFNRLFVFWAETKEIKKSKDEPPTTQATIKYSFLNTSQKWVSPQTLVADVEIPRDFGVTVDKSFWQQVYPMVVPEPNLQSGLITAVFGGLQSLPSSDFNQEQGIFFKARNNILDDSPPELAATIASDLLPDSTPFLERDNSSLTLSQARYYLAATTVGNLAIFAGGYRSGNYFNTVDVFAYEAGTLVKKDLNLTLSEARRHLAATTVGNLAIFAGGYGSSGYFNKVDVFAYQDGTLVQQQTLTLSQARRSLAATTVGNLAIFAGGGYGKGFPNTVDVFAYQDGTLVQQQTLTFPGRLRFSSHNSRESSHLRRGSRKHRLFQHSGCFLYPQSHIQNITLQPYTSNQYHCYAD